MLADGFTKALGPDRHRRLARMMRMGTWQKANTIWEIDEEKEKGQERMTQGLEVAKV